ncbi:MAG: hypothetical protein JWM78_985 [Verrucomicrobiaceae bacterium]|nr:hypothetical protein [Verrucomicrobiaceae bacterium]
MSNCVQLLAISAGFHAPGSTLEKYFSIELEACRSRTYRANRSVYCQPNFGLQTHAGAHLIIELY